MPLLPRSLFPAVLKLQSRPVDKQRMSSSKAHKIIVPVNLVKVRPF